MLSTTPLPAVTGGDFDHFAADSGRHRLYVSAENFGSIEVFDLPSGGHLASEKNVAVQPHKILLANEGKMLYIADAGSASLRIVDTRNFQVKKPSS
ncbi:YncE family protein [Paraburkholderia sp. GAS199]|uniref:YncE family protein n=1 Tax=Paraburkholderia sp. GAS199 TaxID=3035126 RepID=UPI003D1E88B5